MDFQDTPDQAAWREEVRTFIENERPREYDPDKGMQGGEERAPREAPWFKRWQGKLSERGWIAPAWPKEYGGASLGVMEQFIMNEEFAEARVPPSSIGNGVSMLGPTIIAHGTEAQQEEHLGRMLRGEVIWCQGYSEPGSGSDLASLQTRAIRDGDDYVINGQKIWTSGAHYSDWIFMLARTDPDAPKHRGISYFLLDMKTPGITVRPLVNMASLHNFNEVFFEDVRVPAENIVGEVNRGWYVGATTLDFERSSIGSAVAHRQTLERYLDYWRENSDGVSNPESVREALAERWIEAATAKMLSYRVVGMQAAGEIPNAEASIAKMFSTELSQRIAGTAIKMLGTAGILNGGEKAPFEGRLGAAYIASVSATIAGGTSEIQRNIIATRGLGLPRA